MEKKPHEPSQGPSHDPPAVPHRRAAEPLPSRRAKADEPAGLGIDELLRLSPWSAALPAPLRKQVMERMREHRVSKGQLLARRGEIPSTWFGLMEGLLKTSVLAADGRSSTLGGILPGCWFGEGALLRGKPRHADYVALRDSRVALLPLDDFARLLQEHPAFKDFIYAQINERLHYFMDHVGDVRLMRGPARVANALCGLAHPLNNPLGLIHLPIAQDELAAIAGVSRQRCNLALQHMQAEGWLHVGYGQLTLLALEPIADMARAG
ncbi:Crp/Fnr family transcriptional regulator [Variovorax atrisoli]|uniref:Crp/Fnr family transcriptional regulator n=1 Tax=Variovorax atrisoli TaxID=3394203 RepID=UPI0017F92515|nr:Crp/Fnr family transcriptional regulator [Variovorax sp. BK613]MBB3640749.1 CRP-like cAMP-binding protein [Variovorax sp. BK613]